MKSQQKSNSNQNQQNNNTWAWEEEQETYYDLFEDHDLIEASFAQQYGIRLRTVTDDDMEWDEFCVLLSGLNHRTPLGEVVMIRSETDPETIKNFNPQQRKIYNDYKSKQIQRKLERMEAENRNNITYEKEQNDLLNLFRNMSKG